LVLAAALLLVLRYLMEVGQVVVVPMILAIQGMLVLQAQYLFIFKELL
jgi:hypothetical protein